PSVLPSPQRGYRMRARLHVRDGRVGFFREGSHELCDPEPTGQLLDATLEWLRSVESAIARERLPGLACVEIAENSAGDQRACPLELREGESRARYAPLKEAAGREVVDVLHGREGDPASALRLRRDVRAFFQGNRYLLEPLVRHVVAAVAAGPVLDLYAGV